MRHIIREIKYLPQEWIENAHKYYIKDEFCKYFQYQIYMILNECISVITIPYTLWNYCDVVENVINFIVKNTYKCEELGFVCKYAVFENNINNYKLNQSFISFKNQYPHVLNYALTNTLMEEQFAARSYDSDIDDEATPQIFI